MLTMTKINYIRKMFFEKSINYAEIARTTGFDVKTVKKYIFQENFNKVFKPKPMCCSKLDPLKEAINQWLA